MSNTWIKICGITRRSDALAAQELGADAIGLVFYAPSPRCVSVAQIEAIVGSLPQPITVVALFVNPQEQQVREVIDSGLINILQFHGDESPEYCHSFGLPVMKAFRVGGEQDLNTSIARYPESELILLDAYDKQAPGGTGKVFDWQLAMQAAQDSSIKLVLAGGLTPDNIHEAVQRVQPFGVDVSSGVESSPGIKEFNLVKKFIEGVRSGTS